MYKFSLFFVFFVTFVSLQVVGNTAAAQSACGFIEQRIERAIRATPEIVELAAGADMFTVRVDRCGRKTSDELYFRATLDIVSAAGEVEVKKISTEVTGLFQAETSWEDEVSWENPSEIASLGRLFRNPFILRLKDVAQKRDLHSFLQANGYRAYLEFRVVGRNKRLDGRWVHPETKHRIHLMQSSDGSFHIQERFTGVENSMLAGSEQGIQDCLVSMAREVDFVPERFRLSVRSGPSGKHSVGSGSPYVELFVGGEQRSRRFFGLLNSVTNAGDRCQKHLKGVQHASLDF